VHEGRKEKERGGTDPFCWKSGDGLQAPEKKKGVVGPFSDRGGKGGDRSDMSNPVAMLGRKEHRGLTTLSSKGEGEGGGATSFTKKKLFWTLSRGEEGTLPVRRGGGKESFVSA